MSKSRFCWRTGIVVVDEGHGLLGPVADDTGRLVVLIAQAPVLAVLDGLLQDSLGREIKGGRRAAGAVNPVDNCLPCVILVVVQFSAVPPARTPSAHVGTCHSRIAAL